MVVSGSTYVDGISYHQRQAHFGINKSEYNDGNLGISILSYVPSIVLTASSDSTEPPRIVFGRGTEMTSRITEAYPGLISLQTTQSEGVYIGESRRESSLNGYRLMVSGDSSLKGAVNVEGQIWMNSNKIHLGPYTAGVSGLSFVYDRGVVLESALDNSTYEKASNIELYARESGNIVLNTTNGKALYKDAEIATVETTTVLDHRMAALEAEILGANAALTILETNSI